MKKIELLFIMALLYASAFAQFDGESQYKAFSPDGIPFVISQTSWNVNMRGNHRAVVEVEKLPTNTIKAVTARLPWRRADKRIDTKKIVVENVATGEQVKNVHVIKLNAEEGVVAFEASQVGKYYIYYLPYKFREKWDDARYGKPWNDYLEPKYDEAEEWTAKLLSNKGKLPTAKVLYFESRSKFDFFTPMGLIATDAETQKVRKLAVANGYMAVAEDRAFPIRLTDNLPARWANATNLNTKSFVGAACKNEYYTWQIGLWAADMDLNNIKITFSNFSNGSATINANEFTCFNTEGIGWNGQHETYNVNVPKKKIQALWCGVQIPQNAKAGKYQGKLTISGNNISSKTFDININVEDKIMADSGDGDLWRHSRLRWLNSTIGIDSMPVAPYKAMTLDSKNIFATGKKLELDNNGMPANIEINDIKVLSKPLAFIVETQNGDVVFQASNMNVQKVADGLVSWTASSVQSGIHFLCSAYMEYDGYIRYNIKVSADSKTIVNNIKLVSEYSADASNYFMGIGFDGGTCPQTHTWDWKGPYDSYWIGSDKAGVHVEFRGGKYHGPLINDYKPAPPTTWANNGKGGFTLNDKKLTAYCGETELSATPIDFEFAMLITPVKNVNSKKHFSERYFHALPEGFEKAAEEGANIMNIHHARSLNPVINYPFIVRDSLINFINEQHKHNRKVKLYYTIRELTSSTVEIYALKSLNHEIFTAGVGYGVPWLCEHLIDDYKPAWYTELPNQTSDAALVLSGFSRWINYYLEGLRWMFENYNIDGIYMDDVSFDRNVMKRMRKIMAKYHQGALIDLHSNTGYSRGPANQYTDFFPYVDRLWFGESFQYNKMSPDQWFVTFSGIPFGQMSEMLQDGGNRYLGMVYGATARHSWSEDSSPVPVWNLWKTFGIEDAKMIGYWDKNAAVQTSNENVKVTVYIKPDKTLLSIGNFDDKDQTVTLKINWKTLGLNPENVVAERPEVVNFQTSSIVDLSQPISVASKKGWLIIIRKK